MATSYMCLLTAWHGASLTQFTSMYHFNSSIRRFWISWDTELVSCSFPVSLLRKGSRFLIGGLSAVGFPPHQNQQSHGRDQFRQTDGQGEVQKGLPGFWRPWWKAQLGHWSLFNSWNLSSLHQTAWGWLFFLVPLGKFPLTLREMLISMKKRRPRVAYFTDRNVFSFHQQIWKHMCHSRTYRI